jgi:hypothetical protein
VFRIGRLIDTESRLEVTRSLGEQRIRSHYLVGTEFVFGQ